MAVSRVKLAPGGPEVSRLICGTWRIKEDPAGFASERVRERIEACLETGITTFDLADIYGGYECEAVFGAALKADPRLREKMEIISKCNILAPGPGRPDVGVKHYNATAEYIVASVDRALADLGTDYLDVLLIHRPDWLTPAAETARGLDALVRAGKVRHVGVSNYSVAQVSLLASAMQAPVATNQVEISLHCMTALYDGVLAQCERLGIRPMAWSPTGGGRLFDAGDAVGGRLREVIPAMAERYGGATIEQLAVAWLLALPARPVVVLGSNQPERLRAMAAADAIELSREDWYALWQAAQGREVP